VVAFFAVVVFFAAAGLAGVLLALALAVVDLGAGFLAAVVFFAVADLVAVLLAFGAALGFVSLAGAATATDEFELDFLFLVFP
jgi:hypothetical protein